MPTNLTLLACGLAILAPACAPAVGQTPGGPLPLPERVVHGPLSGAPPSGSVRTFATPAALVGALDSDHPAADRAALRAQHFTGAALEPFGDGRTMFGMSLVVRTATATGARALFARDRAEILGGPAGKATGSVRHLRRIPVSLGFVEHFNDGGRPLTFAGVVFADGPYYYVVSIGGPRARVAGQVVFNAAARLYATVHGRPAG